MDKTPTTVTINGHDFELKHMSKEQGTELYTALGQVKDASGQPVGPRYQAMADEMAKWALDFGAALKIQGPEGTTMQDRMDALIRTLSDNAGDLSEDMKKWASDFLSGDKGKPLKDIYAKSGAEGVTNFLGGVGSFFSNAAKPFTAPFNVGGDVADAFKASGISLSLLTKGDVTPEQAKAFGAAYAGAMYMEMDAPTAPDTTKHQDVSKATFWDKIMARGESVPSQLWHSDWFSYVRAFFSCAWDWISSGFKKNFHDCWAEELKNVQDDNKKNPAKSYEQTLDENLNGAAKDGAHKNAIDMLSQSENVAGLDTQPLTDVLRGNAIYSKKDGTWNTLTVDQGTVKSTPIMVRDKDGNKVPMTNGQNLGSAWSKVRDEILPDNNLSGYAGYAAGGFLANRMVRGVRRGYVSQITGDDSYTQNKINDAKSKAAELQQQAKDMRQLADDLEQPGKKTIFGKPYANRKPDFKKAAKLRKDAGELDIEVKEEMAKAGFYEEHAADIDATYGQKKVTRLAPDFLYGKKSVAQFANREAFAEYKSDMPWYRLDYHAGRVLGAGRQNVANRFALRSFDADDWFAAHPNAPQTPQPANPAPVNTGAGTPTAPSQPIVNANPQPLSTSTSANGMHYSNNGGFNYTSTSTASTGNPVNQTNGNPPTILNVNQQPLSGAPGSGTQGAGAQTLNQQSVASISPQPATGSNAINGAPLNTNAGANGGQPVATGGPTNHLTSTIDGAGMLPTGQNNGTVIQMTAGQQQPLINGNLALAPDPSSAAKPSPLSVAWKAPDQSHTGDQASVTNNDHVDNVRPINSTNGSGTHTQSGDIHTTPVPEVEVTTASNASPRSTAAPLRGLNVTMAIQQIVHLEQKRERGENIDGWELGGTAANTVNATLEVTTGKSLDAAATKALANVAPKLEQMGGVFAKIAPKLEGSGNIAVQAVIAAPMIYSAYKTHDTQAIGEAYGATVGTIAVTTLGTTAVTGLAAATATQLAIPIPVVGFVIGAAAGPGVAKLWGLSNTALCDNDPAKRAAAQKALGEMAHNYSPILYHDIPGTENIPVLKWIKIPEVRPGGVVNLVGGGVSNIGSLVDGIGSLATYAGDKTAEGGKYASDCITRGTNAVALKVHNWLPSWTPKWASAAVDLTIKGNGSAYAAACEYGSKGVGAVLDGAGWTVSKVGQGVNKVGEGIEYCGHKVNDAYDWVGNKTKQGWNAFRSWAGWGDSKSQAAPAPQPQVQVQQHFVATKETIDQKLEHILPDFQQKGWGKFVVTGSEVLTVAKLKQVLVAHGIDPEKLDANNDGRIGDELTSAMQKVRGDLQAAEAQMAKNNHKANQPDAGLHLAAVDAHQRNQQQPKGSVEDQAKLAATTMKVNSVKIGATNTHHDPLPSGGGTRQNGIEAHMA